MLHTSKTCTNGRHPKLIHAWNNESEVWVPYSWSIKVWRLHSPEASWLGESSLSDLDVSGDRINPPFFSAMKFRQTQLTGLNTPMVFFHRLTRLNVLGWSEPSTSTRVTWFSGPAWPKSSEDLCILVSAGPATSNVWRKTLKHGWRDNFTSVFTTTTSLIESAKRHLQGWRDR